MRVCESFILYFIFVINLQTMSRELTFALIFIMLLESFVYAIKFKSFDEKKMDIKLIYNS